MSRGSGLLLIMGSNGFQPVLKGLQDQKDDQLSDGNDYHILIASRFPRDPSLAIKDDVRPEVIC
jgi:hypothetical protein